MGEQKDEENELKLLLKRRISSADLRLISVSFDLPRCLIDRGGNPTFGKFLKFSYLVAEILKQFELIHGCSECFQSLSSMRVSLRACFIFCFVCLVIFLLRYYGQKSCLISLYFALHFAGGGVERNGTQTSV